MLIESIKQDAHEAHQKLITLGGRSTRTIQEPPPWKGLTPEESVEFFDGQFRDRLPQLSYEEEDDHIFSHWGHELHRASEEIYRWQQFRDYQRNQSKSERLPEELDLVSTDQTLVDLLNRLSDWQEFQQFQQISVNQRIRSKSSCRLRFEELRRERVESKGSGEEVYYQQWHKVDCCLRDLENRQERLEDFVQPLTFIKEEYPKILAEINDTIATDLMLREDFEARLEKQTKAIYQRLRNLGGTPSHTVRRPSPYEDSLQRLLHWGSEIALFKVELWHWTNFLAWRKRGEDLDNPDDDIRGVSAPRMPAPELCDSLREYRYHQLDKAESWVRFWNAKAKISKEESRHGYKKVVEKAQHHIQLAQEEIDKVTRQLEHDQKLLTSFSSEYNHQLNSDDSTNNVHPRRPTLLVQNGSDTAADPSASDDASSAVAYRTRSKTKNVDMLESKDGLGLMIMGEAGKSSEPRYNLRKTKKRLADEMLGSDHPDEDDQTVSKKRRVAGKEDAEQQATTPTGRKKRVSKRRSRP